MSGKNAAELFYDNSLFTRKGVMPRRIQETLFGKKVYLIYMEQTMIRKYGKSQMNFIRNASAFGMAIRLISYHRVVETLSKETAVRGNE